MYQGLRYEDVIYDKQAPGWVEGVYYPRQARRRTDGSFMKTEAGIMRLQSRVWKEIEETGYGVYYYEETTRFVTELSGSNYVVTAVLANPAKNSYTCHIRLNGVVKEDNIIVEPGEEKSVIFTACMTDGGFALSFAAGAMSELQEEVLEGSVYVKDIEIVPEAAKEKRDKSHIFLISDSTVQSYEKRSYPQTGWGQVLCQFFRGGEHCDTDGGRRDGHGGGKIYELPGLVIENCAIAGRSARSFYDEGRLDRVMEALCPGDFVLVQFAHNDDNVRRPNRYIAPEEFPMFLKRYLDACERRGAQCVFVTPVTMLVTGEDGKFRIAFNNYREKMMELAREQDVPLLDLGERSTAYLNEIGLEAGKEIYLWAEEGEYPDGAYAAGVSDRAHLQEYGAKVYANLVVKLIMEYGADDRLDELKKLAAPRETDEIPKPVRNFRGVAQGTTRDAAQGTGQGAAWGAARKGDKSASDGVTGFVVQEISVENGRGNFLLNWNQVEGAIAYVVYARKKGEAEFRKVQTITRQEKDAYTTLPFSAEAGAVWEYCVAAVFADGREGQAGRVAEVDLR